MNTNTLLVDFQKHYGSLVGQMSKIRANYGDFFKGLNKDATDAKYLEYYINLISNKDTRLYIHNVNTEGNRKKYLSVRLHVDHNLYKEFPKNITIIFEGIVVTVKKNFYLQVIKLQAIPSIEQLSYEVIKNCVIKDKKEQILTKYNILKQTDIKNLESIYRREDILDSAVSKLVKTIDDKNNLERKIYTLDRVLFESKDNKYKFLKVIANNKLLCNYLFLSIDTRHRLEYLEDKFKEYFIQLEKLVKALKLKSKNLIDFNEFFEDSYKISVINKYIDNLIYEFNRSGFINKDIHDILIDKQKMIKREYRIKIDLNNYTKFFVLDSNILVDYYDEVFNLIGYKSIIILTDVVISELEGMKRNTDRRRGDSSRAAVNKYLISDKATLVNYSDYCGELDKKYNDDMILDICVALEKKHKDAKVYLVTNDNLLSIKTESKRVTYLTSDNFLNSYCK